MVFKPLNLAWIQSFFLNFISFYGSGNNEVVDELLRNEADISIPDDSERTILDLAKQQSNYFERTIKPIDILYKIPFISLY